jgi:hypothetical protein
MLGCIDLENTVPDTNQELRAGARTARQVLFCEQEARTARQVLL